MAIIIKGNPQLEIQELAIQAYLRYAEALEEVNKLDGSLNIQIAPEEAVDIEQKPNEIKSRLSTIEEDEE